MHNVKAFLEGLIVNEVLTKTASFEKLAFPPAIYPFIVPPALRAANELLQRWRASQKPPVEGTRGAIRQSGLGVRSQLPTETGNNVNREMTKGKPPTKDEALELAKGIMGYWLDK